VYGLKKSRKLLSRMAKNCIAVYFLLLFCVVYSSTLKIEEDIPSKFRLTFNALCGAVSQRNFNKKRKYSKAIPVTGGGGL
jgi:hypothetical protein